MTKLRYVELPELKVGDVLRPPNHGGVRLTVLRPYELGTDRFGRRLYRFWCRREDTGKEGFMSYGSLAGNVRIEA